VGRALKEAFPGVKVIAVEPQTSAVLSGEPPHPHRIQGIGAGFVPPVLDRSVIDRILPVVDRAAWNMKERLGREEGLLVGISTGANVVASLQIARELGSGARVYTVACDTGERYFSLGEHFAS
jgi:cysteine synthase A